jgi:hypothetical protein
LLADPLKDRAHVVKTGNKAASVDFFAAARAVRETDNVGATLPKARLEAEPLRVVGERHEVRLSVAVVAHQDGELAAGFEHVPAIPQQFFVNVQNTWAKFFDSDANAFALGSYSGPLDERHGRQPYGNQKAGFFSHEQYDAEVEKNLSAYIKKNKITTSNKMSVDQMEEFIELLENGKNIDKTDNEILKAYNNDIKDHRRKYGSPQKFCDTQTASMVDIEKRHDMPYLQGI